MKRNSYILLFALILGFASCKKEEFPASTSNSQGALFKTEGTFDGELVSFGAGVDGYVLSSEWAETYDGNYILTSKFQNQDCPDCNSQLKITMETNTGIHHGNVFSNDVITIEDLPFFRGSMDEVNHIVNMTELYSESQINSAVINGLFSQNSVVPFGISEPIALDYIFSESTTNINNDHYFQLSNSCNSPKLQQIEIFGISVEGNTNEMNLTKPNFGINGDYSWLITWEMDGLVMSELNNSQEDSFSFLLDASVSYYNITMVFNGEDGDLFIQRQNHILPSIDLNVPKVALEVLNIEQIPTPLIKIEYTDEQGTKYVSSNNCANSFHQNTGNYFSISKVEDYQLDANGNQLKLVDFSTNCELMNINNPEDRITLDTFTGTIALPTPN